MKRISAYQATDGSLHPDKGSCRAHQAVLNVVDGLKVIGARMDEDPSLLCDDFGTNLHAIADGDTLAEFIMKHAEDIKAVLSGKILPEVEKSRAEAEAQAAATAPVSPEAVAAVIMEQLADDPNVTKVVDVLEAAAKIEATDASASTDLDELLAEIG